MAGCDEVLDQVSGVKLDAKAEILHLASRLGGQISLLRLPCSKLVVDAILQARVPQRVCNQPCQWGPPLTALVKFLEVPGKKSSKSAELEPSRTSLQSDSLLESHILSTCRQKNQLQMAQSPGSESPLVFRLETPTARLPGLRLRTRLRLLPTRMVVSNRSIRWTARRLLIRYADRQIPSTLSYVDGEEYNGQQAKQQLVRNSKNTVAYFRDYLGQE